MRNYLLALSCCTALLSCTQVKVSEVYTAAAENSLRAPAVPLVTIDPYTSAWSFADQLNDESVRHWTGRDYPLLGSIRVDGKSFRFMGMDDIQVTSVIGTASDGLWEADYTMSQPAGDWFAEAYDLKDWSGEKPLLERNIIRIVPRLGLRAISGYAVRLTGLRMRERMLFTFNIRTMIISRCI